MARRHQPAGRCSYRWQPTSALSPKEKETAIRLFRPGER